jgi:hypothetical protein
MRTFVGCILVSSGIILSGNASAATLLVSPLPTREAEVSVDYSANQVRYDLPGDRFYVKREILSLSWAYESFFASIGQIANTDYRDVGGDPEPEQPRGEAGFMLATGARGAVWREGDLAVNLHAQIHVLSEKAIVSDERYDVESFEILAGAVAAWEPPGWRVYLGIETVPHSDTTTEAPGLEDMSRSDFIIVHAGGGMDIGPCLLDVDVQFVGAEGVRVGLGYAF